MIITCTQNWKIHSKQFSCDRYTNPSVFFQSKHIPKPFLPVSIPASACALRRTWTRSGTAQVSSPKICFHQPIHHNVMWPCLCLSEHGETCYLKIAWNYNFYTIKNGENEVFNHCMEWETKAPKPSMTCLVMENFFPQKSGRMDSLNMFKPIFGTSHRSSLPWFKWNFGFTN